MVLPTGWRFLMSKVPLYSGLAGRDLEKEAVFIFLARRRMINPLPAFPILAVILDFFSDKYSIGPSIRLTCMMGPSIRPIFIHDEYSISLMIGASPHDEPFARVPDLGCRFGDSLRLESNTEEKDETLCTSTLLHTLAGPWFRVEGSGFGVQGLGFRV